MPWGFAGGGRGTGFPTGLPFPQSPAPGGGGSLFGSNIAPPTPSATGGSNIAPQTTPAGSGLFGSNIAPPATPGKPGAGGPGPGSTGATKIGGVDPLQGTGSGGVGITPGGSIDTAIGVAASMFPGLGQAAQTGIKEANRAIQYGSQVAGIMTEGALDTFLPMGGSKLAQNNWLTKIVGGLAGAVPTLPNVAGKPAAPPKKDQQGGDQQGGGDGQGQPNGPVTNNYNITNNRQTEDGTGRDFAWHQQNAALPAGTP
jgi:hypothetical protein